MSKSVLIILFILGFIYFTKGQPLETRLRNKTWFCNSALGTDSLILFADNVNKPLYEIRFSATGKLLFKNIKKRNVDSASTYIIKKRSLLLHFDMKDSVKTFDYQVKKLPGKKAYEMRLKFSSNYTKRKGDDTITMDRFTLLRGKKRRTIEREEEITLFSQKRALHNDSINLAVWGQFVGYISDTLLIDSDQFVEHNFYKKYTDSLHYISPLLFDTIVRIKVPIKEITGIYCVREPFSSFTTDATLMAMGIGLVGVSTSLITKDGSAAVICAQVGVVSFLTIPLSFGMGLIFSKQKFQMFSENKKKKIWRIERHMPGTIVTSGKQKKVKVPKKIND